MVQRLLAHENKLHRSIAERIAPEAVCPNPQIEASRIACAISFSVLDSSVTDRIASRRTSRCSASSWRKSADAARHALPARLAPKKRRDAQKDLLHVDGIVEHPSRLPSRASLRSPAFLQMSMACPVAG